MKYSINNYVGAFMKAVEAVPPRQATVNFIKLLKKTGDIKNADKILEAIHKKMVRNKGGKWVKIESARDITRSRAKSLKSRFSKKDNVTFNINPELVAGIRIMVNGEEELDNTLTKKLNKMFF